MHVTLLTPSAKPSASLMAVSSSVRHIQPYKGRASFRIRWWWPGGARQQAGELVGLADER
ncbi:MAG: hypothetical protein JOY71_04510 [Acetobacteraceae bacterium]|nr:hypothetical protein [Acetobacteraceae bacterium]MBV8521382.1 hypothetical protein [Acetobacteraceae bacterium]